MYRASVTEIMSNRKWYYVACRNCPKSSFLQKGDIPKFVCGGVGIIPKPTFMRVCNGKSISRCWTNHGQCYCTRQELILPKDNSSIGRFVCALDSLESLNVDIVC